MYLPFKLGDLNMLATLCPAGPSQILLRLTVLCTVLYSCAQAFALDMDFPKKVNFKDKSSHTGSYVAETKEWATKDYYVKLTLLEPLEGEPPFEVPGSHMNEETAFQFTYKEAIDSIASNWGKRKEIIPTADWGKIYYKTFDPKKLKIGENTKCASFAAVVDQNDNLLFGFYCKAMQLEESEIASALKSIVLE